MTSFLPPDHCPACTRLTEAVKPSVLVLPDIQCPDCSGDGWYAVPDGLLSKQVQCDACKGTGVIRHPLMQAMEDR